MCCSVADVAFPLLASPLVESLIISFQSCHECSSMYSYRVRRGGTIRVLSGTPSGVGYKAISIVQCQTSDKKAPCKFCHLTFTIPMSSAQKLQSLMRLASPNSTIWLNILSIDQANHEDVAAQEAVMGTIYGNAS
ncbi:hypothetical protein K432DRAFT_462910 [Lepidopterella palustris CBS 459.81]|uniref:Heterokaryon incompatibility domain-containing protein n=1 Tax=Lepidopterella palustris CBS 459.81 TaxID=1314670 RepID=A0A8E2E3H0_9PEZI|nr:hypothetical protein K432DRAFT_462910 [Lepidopterella palustris CBS 459.81]